jgi:hypothetical protein
MNALIKDLYNKIIYKEFSPKNILLNQSNEGHSYHSFYAQADDKKIILKTAKKLLKNRGCLLVFGKEIIMAKLGPVINMIKI